MPFDENLVLQDGTTITADIAPTSLTRAGDGGVCLDIRETGKRGLVVHLFAPTELAEVSDTLQVTIEHCATVDGTYVEIARFPLWTYAAGFVTSAVTGAAGNYSLRFATPLRFIRAKIDITDADSGSDFTVANVRVLLGTVEL